MELFIKHVFKMAMYLVVGSAAFLMPLVFGNKGYTYRTSTNASHAAFPLGVLPVFADAPGGGGDGEGGGGEGGGGEGGGEGGGGEGGGEGGCDGGGGCEGGGK